MTQNRSSTEQILKPDDIKKIRSILREKPRDLLLFDLALYTGSKIKDLLDLRVRDLLGVKVGEEIFIHSGKRTINYIMVESLYNTFGQFMKTLKKAPDDYIFTLQNSSKALSLSHVSVIIKTWFKLANMDGKYTAVSLRKTWEHSISKKNRLHSPIKKDTLIDYLNPIKTPTAQEIVYKELLKAIISGRIAPGTRLTVAEIAKAFNVGISPVRVAFYWLKAKGLITTHKKKASIVNEFSIDDLREMQEIRLILESRAIKASIMLCTEETLYHAESILKQLEEKANTLEEIEILNKKFHQTLYRDAKKPILLQYISDLCERVSPYVTLHFSNKGGNGNLDISYGNKYHYKLIESMRRKDLDEALKNLALDLGKGTPSLEVIFKKRKSLDAEITKKEISPSFKTSNDN